MYGGAEKTFDPYGGFQNSIEPAEERVILQSKPLTEEAEERIRKRREQNKPPTLLQTILGTLMWGSIIAGVIWLIVHFGLLSRLWELIVHILGLKTF